MASTWIRCCYQQQVRAERYLTLYLLIDIRPEHNFENNNNNRNYLREMLKTITLLYVIVKMIVNILIVLVVVVVVATVILEKADLKLLTVGQLIHTAGSAT